jgi:hypothetical protein
VTFNPGDAGKHFLFHDEENFMPQFTDDPVVSVANASNKAAVYGETMQANGVLGLSRHPVNAGVSAVNDAGGFGLWAETKGGQRAAHFEGNVECHGGMFADSQNTDGIFGKSHNKNNSGVAGINEAGGVGVYGRSPGGLAGKFEGDVEVTGDIRLTNADCAEDFNIGADVSVEPGTVMVLGEEGALFPSLHAYDKRVAGVISGAGEYKPGIVLDKQQSDGIRQPVALLGKVFCKVDAQYGAIEVGDPLPHRQRRATP